MNGTNVASVSRRLSGKHALDLDEVEQYARVLGVPVTYLLTGSREQSPDDVDRRGFWENAVRSRPGESNPRPIHYKDTGSLAGQPVSLRLIGSRCPAVYSGVVTRG